NRQPFVWPANDLWFFCAHNGAFFSDTPRVTESTGIVTWKNFQLCQRPQLAWWRWKRTTAELADRRRRG
ncbi:MAG TPA: hypothetical protein VKB35_14820, partial [Ktedonobacteraceae bacterium]|nr:hypothetical protein [Ktedonobacteraceae bacterium]